MKHNPKYDRILSVLKDKIDNAIEDVNYESNYLSTGEEVEHESRPGFMPYTDGGYSSKFFEYSNFLIGSGTKLPTNTLDKKLEEWDENAYKESNHWFISKYPKIVEELGVENIDYNSLVDAGYDNEAEELDEIYRDYMEDDSIMFEIQALYYDPENTRGENEKHTIALSGVVNMEAPYHRTGNLEDFKEITFTFDSIADLKKKMDKNLSGIVAWFNGENYKEGRELEVGRMAQGGRPKSAIARDRKYTSQQKHEQSYKSKRKSKVMGYKKEDGGLIPTDYGDMNPEDIWDTWNIQQRNHFLFDHFYNLGFESISTIASFNGDQISEEVKEKIMEHKTMGRYQKGGKIPKPLKITKKTKFWHVRFKEPEGFTEYKTPDWAERVADSVIDRAEVGTMKSKKTGKWNIQKVMIPVYSQNKYVTKAKAEKYAKDIYKKIEGNNMRNGGKIKKYKLGDMWSMNFDYDGMFEMGLKTDSKWSANRLNKLLSSYKEVDYRTISKPLWEAIKYKETGNNKRAEEELKEFHRLIKVEQKEIMKHGGKTKNNPVSFDQVSSVYYDLDSEYQYTKGESEEEIRNSLSKRYNIDSNIVKKIMDKYKEGKSGVQIYEEIKKKRGKMKHNPY